MEELGTEAWAMRLHDLRRMGKILDDVSGDLDGASLTSQQRRELAGELDELQVYLDDLRQLAAGPGETVVSAESLSVNPSPTQEIGAVAARSVVESPSTVESVRPIMLVRYENAILKLAQERGSFDLEELLAQCDLQDAPRSAVNDFTSQLNEMFNNVVAYLAQHDRRAMWQMSTIAGKPVFEFRFPDEESVRVAEKPAVIESRSPSETAQARAEQRERAAAEAQAALYARGVETALGQVLQLSGDESVRLKVLINDVASVMGVDPEDHEARQQLRAVITDAIDASDTYMLSRVKGVESVIHRDAASESADATPESRRNRDAAPLDNEQRDYVIQLVMQGFASQDTAQGPRRIASIYDAKLRKQLDALKVDEKAFRWAMRQASLAGLLESSATRRKRERSKNVSDLRYAVGPTGSAVKNAITAGRVDDARALISKAFEPEEDA